MKQTATTSESFGGSSTTLLPDSGTRADSFEEGSANSPLVRVEGLTKEYAGNRRSGRGALRLFDELSFTVQAGELLAIVGQSGSGKSTLLHMLGALDAPSSGTIYCGSTQITQLSNREAARFRNEEVGYVWQFHYLLPEFSAQENVAMPLMARGVPKRQALDEAAHWPGELSGGEQQRVALARALVTRPRLLLADEPTGDLDGESADLVFGLIERLHAAHGLTSVLVTHNLELARRCTRTLRLAGGRLEEVSHSNSTRDDAFVTQLNSR
jgi:lipoprotein-releasing system ATP-binding protein